MQRRQVLVVEQVVRRPVVQQRPEQSHVATHGGQVEWSAASDVTSSDVSPAVHQSLAAFLVAVGGLK